MSGDLRLVGKQWGAGMSGTMVGAILPSGMGRRRLMLGLLCVDEGGRCGGKGVVVIGR